MDNQTSAFARNLKALRADKGLTQQQLADLLQITQQTVYMWERGGIDRPRSSDIVAKLCEVFCVSEQELLGYSDGYSSRNPDGIIPAVATDDTAPYYGIVAAGDPREACEIPEEHWVPAQVKEKWPEGFFLRCVGDSMNLVIPDGAYVYIVPDIEIRSGDIAAVRVNGDDATIKRIQLFDNIIILVPESTNPEHRRRVIDVTDPASPDVRFIGKATWIDYALVRI